MFCMLPSSSSEQSADCKTPFLPAPSLKRPSASRIAPQEARASDGSENDVGYVTEPAVETLRSCSVLAEK